MKRKDFLKNSALAVAGISLYTGCKESNPIAPIEIISEEPPFPYLEISGTNYEVGKKIGEYFKPILEEHFRRSNDLVQFLLGLVNSDPEKYYTPFYNAGLEAFPQYVDELKGMADGSGIPFKTIMTYNLVMEIQIRHAMGGGNNFSNLQRFGCSDISYSSNDKTLMGHNEDFFKAMADLLYCAKISISGKPTFVGLNYPGMICGIPPAMNEAGLVQTGNFITSLEVNDGVPWVFLARAIMDQEKISDVVTILKTPSSYAQHYQVGSFIENKIKSVEFTTGASEEKELNGFYVHTNHLILPTMKDLPQHPDDTTYNRYDILSAYAKEYKNRIDEVTPDKMVEWLSNHDGSPNYVCVHGDDSVTVSSTIFDFQDKSWRLYKGNPCYGYYKTIRL